MFDEAGVPYPTDDWTWDDMLDAAKKLTIPEKEQYGFYIDPFLIWKGIWTKAAGGSVISPDYKKSMLTSPETAEAITWLWDAIWKHKVAIPPPPPNSNQPFLDRKVAMTIDGIWWLPDFNKGLEEGEYDVAMLPKHPTHRQTDDQRGIRRLVDLQRTTGAGTRLYLLNTWQALKARRCLQTWATSSRAACPRLPTPWYDIKPPESKAKVLENITDGFHQGRPQLLRGLHGSERRAAHSVADAFSNGTDIAQVLPTGGSGHEYRVGHGLGAV